MDEGILAGRQPKNVARGCPDRHAGFRMVPREADVNGQSDTGRVRITSVSRFCLTVAPGEQFWPALSPFGVKTLLENCTTLWTTKSTRVRLVPYSLVTSKAIGWLKGASSVGQRFGEMEVLAFGKLTR